jgi:hypothetical membrane protein
MFPRTLPPVPPDSRLDRVGAAAGLVGVGGFVAAWAIRGALRPGYSAVDDAISRLAEVGAPGRGWMTAGFVAFGVGMAVFAQAVRKAVPGPAWMAATVTGLATLGVAAAPLGRADTAHYAFATVGYVTLAATPLLAARAFGAAGARRWAQWSVGCGVASALLLAASTIDRGHGLTQRLGLGATDGWIVAVAIALLRHPGRIYQMCHGRPHRSSAVE